jgi:hypothetical protein
MSKPNDETMVQRCGCYSDAAAVVACVKLLQVTEMQFRFDWFESCVGRAPHSLLQQRLPSLKALAVPTPSDVDTDADVALLVQVCC